MDMQEIQDEVCFKTEFGFRICGSAHGQIMSESNKPLVNIWTNKKLWGDRIRFLRVGAEEPARVGTIEEAIAVANPKGITIRIGDVMMHMRRDAWLQAIADIANALKGR
jgi:hypothetical protein